MITNVVHLGWFSVLNICSLWIMNVLGLSLLKILFFILFSEGTTEAFFTNFACSPYL